MNSMSEQEFIFLADKYLRKELDATERTAFEAYCTAHPDKATQLTTHQLFLEQLQVHADRKALKQELTAIADKYAAGGPLEAKQTTIITTLWNRFKINSLVAASVAIIAVFSTLWLSGYYKTIETATSNYSALRRDMNTVKKNVNAQNAVINSINSGQRRGDESKSHFGATGFIVSTNGYVVTNYHVIKDADSVHLQNSKGDAFRAEVIYIDPANDLALLHIGDSAFKPLKSMPYTFKAAVSDVGEDVFTVGFPRDDMVYGQGYLSSQTGYAGDTTAYQISIPVNPGNSGGPVLDSRGNVIGIISGKQKGLDGASFAIKSEALLKSIEAIPQDSLTDKLVMGKKNTLQGLARTEQVKRIQDYVYMVKVF
ncbi:S1C family serine protease [Parapedobacter lycopersici]|uniref:S1C family serine protease n=1 Tax=Parapedobacter lycopersici TaxID=1864939 RepID=UPI00214D63C9|nr:serine protease [Parapedobacter lycopersici]